MRSERVLRSAAVRGKRCLSRSLRELIYHKYPLCLIRWDCFLRSHLVDQRCAEVVDLHVFADASLDAMCVVAFFRDQQTGELAYVVGKSRLAPMKQQSIARLVLQAAMYGTRLNQLLVDKHDIEIERVFWTDSTTVWQCLHGADK